MGCQFIYGTGGGGQDYQPEGVLIEFRFRLDFLTDGFFRGGICGIVRKHGIHRQKHIPFVAIVGENEMKSKTVMLKNMITGTQEPLTIEQLKQL